MTEIEEQLDRMRRFPFSKRKAIFERIQANVSEDRLGKYGPAIAWPDVMLFMSADHIRRAIDDVLSESKEST